MKHLYSKKIFVAVFAAIIVGALFIIREALVEQKNVHYHAGFLVYEDGKLQDFSDIRYMHIAPCTGGGHDENENDPEHEQEEKAHLHDGVGDVVHVHRENAKWKDLFQNIEYVIEDEKIEGYIDGKKVPDILNKIIKPYESVVFVVGDSSNVDLSKVVTQERIKSIEGKSETCGS